MRIECGTCQHKAWEDAWKMKLDKANMFLDKLRQRRLPGMDEINVLVKGLEAEYTTASWDTRKMFAEMPKPIITRIKHSYYQRSASKLPQEVRPEDVIEKAVKDWADMKVHDYDDNYIASTDPIHPVSTDYSHPLDDDDGAWILQHLSQEDVAETHSSTNLDFSSNNDWDWGENNSSSAGDVDSPEWNVGSISNAIDGRAMQQSRKTETSLMAWGPEVSTRLSKSRLYLSDPSTNQAEHKIQVEHVIEAFWSLVNNEEQPSPSPTPINNDNNISTSLLHDFTIAESSSHSSKPSEPSESSEPSPASPSPLWTDGPSDIPPTPQPHGTPLPSHNSTRAWDDKQRKILNQHREADLAKYYRDWLYISRCEMRDFEGTDGNGIRDPIGGRGS
jgi:hypothetical protein